MDREAWRAAVHGVAKSRARLSDWTELNCAVQSGESLLPGESFPWRFPGRWCSFPAHPKGLSLGHAHYAKQGGWRFTQEFPASPGWGWSAGSLGCCKQGPPAQPWALAACVLCAQSCPTLCNPLDWSPPGSPVPEILQARTVEWVAIPFSRGSSWLWEWTTASRKSPALQADALPLSHWGTEGNAGCWARCLEHPGRNTTPEIIQNSLKSGYWWDLP